jgi:hypothetical protein
LKVIYNSDAIEDYVVICDETNNTPERIEEKQLWLDVAIRPTGYPEFIYIPARAGMTV